MCSDLAVKVESLSKCFHVYASPRDRLKQFVLPRVQRAMGKPGKQYFNEFWALKDVSLEIGKGETVGVVGRNGSGKSTLLQIICGTLNPTKGSVFSKGRIGALLELGSGFNPEFTGRENVYMNAAILGLSKSEIDARFKEIIEFADIGDFLDQPVRVYSSGMMVRLAFAVQAQIEPDILIVDEALAVGDAKFQARCFERLKQLKNNGTSILLVTHSSDQIVTHCDRALLLEKGYPIEMGEPRTVVNHYLDLLFGKSAKQHINNSDAISDDKEVTAQSALGLDLSLVTDKFSSRPGYNEYEYRWGDGQAKILDFCLLQNGVQYPATLLSGRTVELAFTVKFYETIVRPILGITIKTKEGVVIYGANTEMLNVESFQNLGQRGDSALVRVAFDGRLAAGDYFISVGIASGDTDDVVPRDRRYDAIHVHVVQEEKFYGLADLGMAIRIEDTIQ